ncbi:MAG TPA: hypothetical protein PKW35_19845 [Nannocystaceae bacterium]|nr:hypothetical protein [Nannocystaceae bacterium]
MASNTLQIYLNEIYFDRPTVVVMYGYVVTFAQANVDGDFQMYLSPASFRIVRIDRPGQPDQVHRYDGDGLLVASFPTEGLSNVTLTAFFVRDRERARDTGALLSDLFKDEGAGSELVEALAPLVSMLPRVGAVAAAVLRVQPRLANLIAEILKRRNDVIKIYAEGGRKFNGPASFVDAEMVWGVGGSDKGFFRTTWDFCATSNPYAVVKTLVLPDSVKHRLGIDE